MATPIVELEGTWEEVAAHAAELAGRRVHLTVLPSPEDVSAGAAPAPVRPPAFRPASGRPLLRHAGTWQGDDFEDCLRAVLESRGPAEFRDE